MYFNSSISCSQKPWIDKAADKCLWASHVLFHGRTISIENGKVVKEEPQKRERFARTLLAILLLLPGTILGVSLKLIATFSCKVRNYRRIVSQYDLERGQNPKKPVTKIPEKPPAPKETPTFTKEIVSFLKEINKQPIWHINEFFTDSSGKIRDVIRAEELLAITEAIKDLKDPGRIHLQGQSLLLNRQGKEDFSGMHAFAEMLSEKKRRWYLLDFSATGLNDEAVRILTEGMEKAAKNGKASIGCLDISYNNISKEAFQKVVAALQSQRTDRIRMNGIAFDDEKFKRIIPLLTALPGEIKMNGCNLTAAQMKLIADVLSQKIYDFTSLPSDSIYNRWLEFNHNLCRDTGAKAFASFISKTQSRTQTHLELKNNGITYQGFKAIVEAIATLPKTKEFRSITIDLSDNQIAIPHDDKEIQALEALLAKMEWQDYILLKGNPLNPPVSMQKMDSGALHRMRISKAWNGSLVY